MSRISQPPRCLALIPCQSAALDPATGLWNIRGTFGAMFLETFPALVPEIFVYMALGKGSADKNVLNLAINSPSGDMLGGAIVQVGWGDTFATEHCCRLEAVIFRTP